ncbi:hypothetical protein D8B26_005352 [Coccidioides posadasii str. Silveira]|nr:hypothetical protein D8B26_005352 [Coccidioides posadasii str. Silveira]
MRMCIERKDDFDVLRDGEQSTDLNVRDYTISTALYQGTMPLEAISGARCSLMNIWLPKELWHLRPERSLRNELRILKDTELELSANFAPAGTFVDIHIDQNRHALSQSIGNSKRIWLVYPPTESNLQTFVQSSGESGRLTKISDQLEGGYIMEVDSSRIVYLPPGWIHATFTIASGILVGVNFVSLESLSIMSQSLVIHFQYFFRLQETFEEDLDVYQQSLTSFLDCEFDEKIIERVLESWSPLANAFRHGCEKLETQYPGKMQEWRQQFLDVWKGGLMGKTTCCCGSQYEDGYQHIQEKHMWP